MRTLLTSFVLATAAVPATAEEFQPQWIPAGTRWVAHIDVEAALKSSLFKAAMKMEDGAAQQGIDEIKRELGFDPFGIFHGVTVFSAGEGPEDAVAMMVMSDVDAVLAALNEVAEGELGEETVMANGFEFQRYSADGESFFSCIVPIEGEERSVVMLSERQELLVPALEVFTGERPNMADADDAALTVRPKAGSYFFVAATGLDSLVDQLGGASTFARGAKSLVFEGGESGDELFVSMMARTENAETAQKLQMLFSGLQAFSTFLDMDDEDAQQIRMLLGNLEMRARGDTFRMGLRLPLDMIQRELFGDGGL